MLPVADPPLSFRNSDAPFDSVRKRHGGMAELGQAGACKTPHRSSNLRSASNRPEANRTKAATS